jgi:copper(I)-binding protein
MKKLLSLLLMAALPALAQVTVGEPWVRATVAAQSHRRLHDADLGPAGQTGGRSSPAAGVVEVHEMKMENDMMRMRQMPALDLPAGQLVKLAPAAIT